MTDDDINELVAMVSNEPSDAELRSFVRTIAAKEREACAEICDRFQARDVGMQPAECAGAIRAKGE